MSYAVDIDFSAAPTVSEFLKSKIANRFIIGPVGSGKTVGCCIDIMQKALEQKPSPDGYRRFKAGIIRNTMPELRRTTMETWLALFPEDEVGELRKTVPVRHRITRAPEGWQYGVPEKLNAGVAGLDLLVDFFALDRPDHVKILLSYECTAIWFNELREIQKSIVDTATDRVGRYPSYQKGGLLPTWFGVLGDTNPPDTDHWLCELEESKPETYEFFHQPPGVIEVELQGGIWVSKDPAFPDLSVDDEKYVTKGGSGIYYMVNPGAENLENLPYSKQGLDDATIELWEADNPDRQLGKRGYYPTRIPGKDEDHIRGYYQGRYGFVHQGKPVIPEFQRRIFVVDDLPVIPNTPLGGGFDVGGGTLNPAGVLCQRYRGVHLIHAEVAIPDIGLNRFSTELKAVIAELFPGVPLGNFGGDPAGRQRDPLFEFTAFEHLLQHGIQATPTETNDPKVRIEAIKAPFTRMVDAKPGILIHSRCVKLIKGLQGAWYYRRIQVSGASKFREVPEKNDFSHVCDALGYYLLSAGEGRILRQGIGYKPKQQREMDTSWNPMKY